MSERGWGRWVDAIEPAEVRIECGGAVHTVRWRRGRIVLVDHGLDAERAVIALGGDPPPCLRVLRAWPRWDPLNVGSPTFPLSGAMPESIPAPEPVRLAEPAVPWRPPGTMPAAHRKRILKTVEMYHHGTVLGALPPAMAIRQALGVVMAGNRRMLNMPLDTRLALDELLSQRARAAVVESMHSWRRIDPVVLPRVECAMLGNGEKPVIEGRIERDAARAAVSLPLSWLATVWAAGVPVVDGCFVLSFRGNTVGGEAQVVRWERVASTASVPVVVPAWLTREADGRWHARWA